MSTKIYNGVKFKSNDLNVVLKQLKDIVPEATAIARQELVSKEIRKIIINQELYDADPYDVQKQMETSASKSRRDWDYLCINFSIFVYPHPNGNLYGYYFNDIKEYKKLIFDNICEDYHYQDNTDQSNYDWEKEPWESMSDERKAELDKDWKERDDVWEHILGDGSIRYNGFEYTIVDGGSDLWSMRIIGEIEEIQKTLREQKIRKDKLEKLNETTS